MRFNLVYSRRLANVSITPITPLIVATSFPTRNGNTLLLNLSCQYASKNVQTGRASAKSFKRNKRTDLNFSPPPSYDGAPRINALVMAVECISVVSDVPSVKNPLDCFYILLNDERLDINAMISLPDEENSTVLLRLPTKHSDYFHNIHFILCTNQNHHHYML